MLNEEFKLNDWQLSHSLQGSLSWLSEKQLIVFAKIRAHVVLPTPRGPQKTNACANWLLRMAFFKVLVIVSCPTTDLNVTGRYFLAETM
jgi:hypothetical protein